MPRYIIFLCVYFDHLPLARVRRQNEIASRVGHGHLRMIANRNSCSGYHSKVFIHHNSANHRGGFGDQWNRGGRVIIVRQDDHRLTLHKLILGDGGESHFAVGRPRLLRNIELPSPRDHLQFPAGRSFHLGNILNRPIRPQQNNLNVINAARLEKRVGGERRHSENDDYHRREAANHRPFCAKRKRENRCGDGERNRSHSIRMSDVARYLQELS